ncbi:hypothetical protein H696_02143 [Fonticula alba]|uniref:G domain-containing protein n=1 Tax=Fonticula alba TaxID=691883 RepID=A0A058ZB82_FONAL|nr:hypothetical protein H696_02143 [Fonticula alba]KCV71191.1 hypothetical protein H696_02143 [Fonticula alba]|eukprot:XP_009494314.1 hypothetical protein H696_02143 [Fonticula alba]
MLRWSLVRRVPGHLLPGHGSGPRAPAIPLLDVLLERPAPRRHYSVNRRAQMLDQLRLAQGAGTPASAPAPAATPPAPAPPSPGLPASPPPGMPASPPPSMPVLPRPQALAGAGQEFASFVAPEPLPDRPLSHNERLLRSLQAGAPGALGGPGTPGRLSEYPLPERTQPTPAKGYIPRLSRSVANSSTLLYDPEFQLRDSAISIDPLPLEVTSPRLGPVSPTEHLLSTGAKAAAVAGTAPADAAAAAAAEEDFVAGTDSENEDWAQLTRLTQTDPIKHPLKDFDAEQVNLQYQATTEAREKAASQVKEPRVIRVAIIGTPNSGKSTLLNALIGGEVSISSRKANTTRTNTLGILTRENVQIVFVDTPGILSTKVARKSNLPTIEKAWKVLDDVDLVVLMIDCSKSHQTNDVDIAKRLAAHPSNVEKLIVFNKTDIASSNKDMSSLAEFYGSIFANIRPKSFDLKTPHAPPPPAPPLGSGESDPLDPTRPLSELSAEELNRVFGPFPSVADARRRTELLHQNWRDFPQDDLVPSDLPAFVARLLPTEYLTQQPANPPLFGSLALLNALMCPDNQFQPRPELLCASTAAGLRRFLREASPAQLEYLRLDPSVPEELALLDQILLEIQRLELQDDIDVVDFLQPNNPRCSTFRQYLRAILVNYFRVALNRHWALVRLDSTATPEATMHLANVPEPYLSPYFVPEPDLLVGLPAFEALMRADERAELEAAQLFDDLEAGGRSSDSDSDKEPEEEDDEESDLSDGLDSDEEYFDPDATPAVRRANRAFLRQRLPEVMYPDPRLLVSMAEQVELLDAPGGQSLQDLLNSLDFDQEEALKSLAAAAAAPGDAASDAEDSDEAELNELERMAERLSNETLEKQGIEPLKSDEWDAHERSDLRLVMLERSPLHRIDRPEAPLHSDPRVADMLRGQLNVNLSEDLNLHGFFMISAAKQRGLDPLVRFLMKRARPGPWEYSADASTDLSIETRINEIIRQQLLEYTHEEIPWEAQQATVGWTPLKGFLRIDHVLTVPREAHRAKIVGRNGTIHRAMVQNASARIEKLLGTQVMLVLHVRVAKRS